MAFAVLYDQAVPPEIRSLAQERAFGRIDNLATYAGPSLEERRAGLQLAFDANPGLLLWKSELHLLLKVNKDYVIPEQILSKYNIRKR